MRSTPEILTDAGGATSPASVRVWDLFVRLFHWGLVAGFSVAFVTADEWDRVHELAGYFAVTLVSLRLVWGLIGTRHARFSDFVRGPGTVLGYLRDVVGGRERRFLGHNPAGGAMVIALLTGILGLGATGILMTQDAFWGEEWLEEVHEVIANGMLLLIALHIAGVMFTSLRHGENLVKSMITGRKRAGM